MKRVSGLIAAFAVVMCLAAVWATAAPKPNAIPTEWELEIMIQAPKPIQVVIPGQGGPETYWYVMYTVTNNTGDDRVFVPRVSLYTDTGQVRRGSEGIYPAVYAAIQDRHNNPYLQDLADISGKILQGADNAKDGVAIFKDFDPKARVVDVFFSGLSGETVKIKLPKKIMTDEIDIRGVSKKVLKDEIILHKTLQMTYAIPGEAAARYSTQPRLDKKTWVMR